MQVYPWGVGGIELHSFLTSAINVGGQFQALAALPPEYDTRYPLNAYRLNFSSEGEIIGV
jgi:hypothetical protein